MPPNSVTLDKVTAKQQIRLGIQGYPGTGKTWSALTFNNPIVLNLDRGLGAHAGRADVIEVPFYNPSFGTKEQIKDKLITWLDVQGKQISDEQTLVIDGLSSLEVAYHTWFTANERNFLTTNGKVDAFAEWQVKKKYFGELFEALKVLKCDVVLLAHEAARPDKPTTVGQPGMYSGKIRPLLTGAYGDIIGRDFTDWFRMHSAAKPADYSKLEDAKLKSDWDMNKEQFKDMCNTFDRDTIYYWQTCGDDLFDAKASSLVNFPKYIPANYKSFNKYMRKIGGV